MIPPTIAIALDVSESMQRNAHNTTTMAGTRYAELKAAVSRFANDIARNHRNRLRDAGDLEPAVTVCAFGTKRGNGVVDFLTLLRAADVELNDDAIDAAVREILSEVFGKFALVLRTFSGGFAALDALLQKLNIGTAGREAIQQRIEERIAFNVERQLIASETRPSRCRALRSCGQPNTLGSSMQKRCSTAKRLCVSASTH